MVDYVLMEHISSGVGLSVLLKAFGRASVENRLAPRF